LHVLKGKKLPGQMGNVTRTVQNLEIIQVDKENNCILVDYSAFSVVASLVSTAFSS